MYTHHFGLNKLPFENVPDPVFFFDEGDYARVHNRIRESLKAGRGLIVVTGPIGSGKTTQSQKIIAEFSNDIKLIWMAEPPSNSTDLFLFIAEELGLKPATPEKTFVLRDIRDALMKINAAGSRCLVIIDESHLMSDDTINGVRLLNNLEEGPSKLIQLLLLGQEELLGIINRPDMEHFKQRIASLEILGRMNSERVRHYISHRIHVAGGNPSLFTDTGWEALVLAAGTGGGIPRVVNLLCDRSLNAAFERNRTAVDVDDVYEAAEGLSLSKEIFHYKVSLKNRDKKIQAQPAVENARPEKDIKINAQPVHPAPSFSRTQEEGRKGLKRPALFLVISAAALVLSIAFYCQRSDTDGIMSCILELIGL
ncbi:MAG: AAA family ATPase [Nitrospirota bacterium]|nr:AAA family ATPase [Nitrospirota bacterium]